MTPVHVINLALNQIGGGALQTFDESTPLGKAAQMAWATTIDGLFSEHPWTFLRRTVRLDTVNVTLDADGRLPNGWTKCYRLPAERIGPPSRLLANPRDPHSSLTDFTAEEDFIYCDDDAVWAVLYFRADPDQWPAAFLTAAVSCLAAELVMPVSGNSGLLAACQAKAWGSPAENRMGGLLGVAKRANDTANASTSVATSSPLVSARY